MGKKQFYVLLALIAVLGIFLRLVSYDRTPPFGETRDEFIYPWAGITLLQTGAPSTWSDFAAYTDAYPASFWGMSFRMITPWLDKPPLYALLTGTTELLFGHTQFGDVQLTTLRLVPIVLNTFAILFLGLWVNRLWNKKTALVSSLIYATVPIIVLANRLSVTENLLIPLVLATLWWYEKSAHQRRLRDHIIIASGCVAAILTKQIGLVLPLTLIIASWYKKDTKTLYPVAFASAIALLVHPFMGLLYGWETYVSVMKELRSAHALGLPEALPTLFRFPGIGHKESLFLDGSLLAGLILLISSSLWSRDHHPTFIFFPIIFLLFLTLGEGGQTWYGWHIFPLYPFAAIALGKAFVTIYEEKNYWLMFLLFTFLATSGIRFLLLITSQSPALWQPLLMGLYLLAALVFFTQKKTWNKYLLLGLFMLYVGMNIFTVYHLSTFYPTMTQPGYESLQQ